MFEEGFLPFTPAAFFQLEWDCPYVPADSAESSLKSKAYLLPDTGILCREKELHSLSMGWNREGLHFLLESSTPFHDVFYPDIARGDSLELFIDTRDVKSGGFLTKFSHHFFFLPQEVEGIRAGEMTRFRGEDSHELCDSKELQVQSDLHKKGYRIKIFIPSHCLYGYDPEQFDRIGFTYRLNRWGSSAVHFSNVSEEFAIEQQPALWSSVRLIDANRPLQKPSNLKR